MIGLYYYSTISMSFLVVDAWLFYSRIIIARRNLRSDVDNKTANWKRQGLTATVSFSKSGQFVNS